MFIMCKLWENYRERSKKSQIFEIDLRIFLFTIFPEVVGTYLRRETWCRINFWKIKHGPPVSDAKFDGEFKNRT